MTNNDENHMRGMKEYMKDMEKLMNMWFNKMHDIYLMLSSVLLTLSVAAIGFAASYILENGYHSYKYETSIAYVSLGCLFTGVLFLIISCACGLTHMLENLGFLQCTAEFFAKRYREATRMYYQKTIETNTEEENKMDKCQNPGSHWWYGQIASFGCGIFCLIAWVIIDYGAVPDNT